MTRARTHAPILAALILSLIAGASAARADRDAVRAERKGRLEAILKHALTAPRALTDGEGRLITLRGRFLLLGATPREAAATFLRDNARLLGVHDPAHLTHSTETHDAGGTVLRYAQRHEGVPVIDGAIVIGFDPSGALVHLANRTVHALPESTVPALDAAAAVRRAGGATVVAAARPRLVIVRGDKAHPGHHLAWEVLVPGDRHVYVGSERGEIVAVRDLLRGTAPPCAPCDADVDAGCGRIFFDNPVVRLDDPSLRDGSNVNAAHQDCALSNLVSATRLDGIHVSTAITGPRYGPPWNRLRSSDQQAVDEVNAYYHADRAKRYLDQIGFPGVMNFPVAIDAHDAGVGDNSFYSLSTKEIHFGTGGVDDALDPDIIYHEYGHAIQDNQVPNFGTTNEGGAMGEGFGDYWAAALLDHAEATLLGRGCIGAWDATAYNPWTGTFGTGCLRRIDHPWIYPQDVRFQLHGDGEIWSAFLWDLRAIAGGAVGDALVIKSHTFLTADARFMDGADAILSADMALHGGTFTAAVESARIARRIPRTAAPAPDAGVDTVVPYACSSSHNYANLEYRECRVTVPGAGRVRFHFSRFHTEAGWDFAWISDADYNTVQVISGEPFGGGAGLSATVPGDTIVLRFRADQSIRRYGFDIDEVRYAPAPPQSPGQVPNGASVPGAPLLVQHAPGGDLILAWGGSCGAASDYAVYEGVLGSFTTHVPRACSTGGATAITLTPDADSAYYLVVPIGDPSEGSYGQRSDATERPPSAIACASQQSTGGC